MRQESALLQLLKAVRAPDSATRRMARFFWLSTGLAALTAIWGGQVLFGRFREAPVALEDTQTAENLSRLVNRQKQSAKVHASTLGLGRFNFELKASSHPRSQTGPFSNSAEIEVFVECDRKATCDQVESNPTLLRDQMTVAIVGQDRDSLLTSEGKLKLKRSIQRKLNEMVRDGSIRQVYFSDFVLN